jgi:cob(I)alamin adenosyltransferase
METKANLLKGSTGDDGTTGLPGGVRAPKSEPIFDALGSLDELTAAIGLLRCHLAKTPEASILAAIQRDLVDIGGEVATQKPNLEPGAVDRLGRERTQIEKTLPKSRTFVLPGANEGSARAHWARTVCRRAERDMVRLRDAAPDRVLPTSLPYLNRLSSLLFAMARNLERRTSPRRFAATFRC